jgi:hypothetical protein
MKTGFYRILDIASRCGRRDLVDTPEELSELRAFLDGERIRLEKEESAGRESEIVDAALRILDRNPGRSFSIVPPHFSSFPACGEELTDCYTPIFPLEEGVYSVFPIRSGGPFADHLDYVAIAEETWQEISESLRSAAERAEEERAALKEAVERFDTLVASDEDVPGFIGNVLPMRGQQDCTDEMVSLAPLLHALSAEGYLEHHSFDYEDYQLSVPGYHYAIKLCEAGGACFAVDAWNGLSITEAKLWEFQHRDQQQIWMRPRF